MKDVQNFEYKINGTLFQHTMFRIVDDVYNVCAVGDVDIDSAPVLLTVVDRGDIAVINDIYVEQTELMDHVLNTNMKYLGKPFIINLSPIADDYLQMRSFLDNQGFDFVDDEGILRGIRKVIK